MAASTTRIVRALMFNESVVLPVSTYLDGQYGQDGVFTSVPAILDATGVKEVVEIEMTKEEKEQFDSSCSHLQSFYKEV
jgi:L-lactate dehydrogenase